MYFFIEDKHSGRGFRAVSQTLEGACEEAKDDCCGIWHVKNCVWRVDGDLNEKVAEVDMKGILWRAEKYANA